MAPILSRNLLATQHMVTIGGDPQELGMLMGELGRRYAHIDIWGGCCGTWDTHLDEIARNVRSARELPA